ncbi:hypothetical protein AB1484_38005 [Parafrankia sp. FMc6]|uniref:hypothetical protein n=1 Tax=Parafrankia soli TaxID=2599596 RepID=UPI0034D76DC6
MYSYSTTVGEPAVTQPTHLPCSCSQTRSAPDPYGTAVTTRGQVDSAAHTAARAASIARTPAAAVTAAEQAIAPDLTSAGPCTTVTVQVDTSQFHPGGVARATVACLVDQSDLAAGLPIPGQRTFIATASAPIDLYRTITTARLPTGGPVLARIGERT